jgi:hypothetical protein
MPRFYFLVIMICIHDIGFAQLKKNTPELFLGSGFTYGFKTDFINTANTSMSLRPSPQFNIGVRFFNKKSTLMYDITTGVNSINTITFVGKNNFVLPTAEDINSFLPPLYEFPFVQFQVIKPIKIVEKNKLNVQFLIGAGIKYNFKIAYDHSWGTLDFSGNEFSNFDVFFDRKIDKTSGMTSVEKRGIIFSYYVAVSVTPRLFKQKALRFELYLNPSLNAGMQARYALSTPVIGFIGNNKYKFSTAGIKIGIPYINIKNSYNKWLN